MPVSKRVLALLAALLAVLTGGGVLVLTPDDKTAPPAEVRITVPVPGPDKVIEADRDQQLDAGEQDEAHDGGIDLHEDSKDETPPGVSAEALAAGEQKTADLAEKELVAPQRPAGAQNYSCKRRPVVNQSALTQRRVGVALHFTVSNPGSLNAIFGLFNRASFGASSNYGFELYTLGCEQWVPEGRKAWAQLAANSAYVSIEIITKDRSRASWLATPALKRGVLAALVRDIAKRHGAPLKFTNPSGCVFTAGITDHEHLECGNDHWDVGKNFPWDVFIAQVRRGTTPSPLTAAQRRSCDLLNYHRARAHQIGKWYPSRLARARELKATIPTGRCPSKYTRR